MLPTAGKFFSLTQPRMQIYIHASLPCKSRSTKYIKLMGEETGLFNVAKSRLYMLPEWRCVFDERTHFPTCSVFYITSIFPPQRKLHRNRQHRGIIKIRCSHNRVEYIRKKNFSRGSCKRISEAARRANRFLRRVCESLLEY